MNDNMNIDSSAVMRRLFRAVSSANQRYQLTDAQIRMAMADAVQIYLNTHLGDNQAFETYWVGDTLHVLKTMSQYSISPYLESEFDLGALGEFRVREILLTFQKFLDYSDSLSTYERVKSLKNSLIYGRVVRYTDGVATVSFYDQQGYELIGFCTLRHLLPDERDFVKLSRMGLMYFYVRSVVLTDSRVQINLSRKSLRIPELLIKESLQENGYNLSEYRFECVRRIGGRRSLVVSLGKLPKSIHKNINAVLSKESVRIFAIDKNSSDARHLLSGKAGFSDIVSKYIDLSTIKSLNPVPKVPEPTRSYSYSADGSFLRKLSGK